MSDAIIYIFCLFVGAEGTKLAESAFMDFHFTRRYFDLLCAEGEIIAMEHPKMRIDHFGEEDEAFGNTGTSTEESEDTDEDEDTDEADAGGEAAGVPTRQKKVSGES